MSIEDSAKVILAGEQSRRRGYLTSVISNMDALAVTGTLAIWAFLVKWDILLAERSSLVLFPTQIAWASALSSVLIGVWRFYVRFLDSSIIRLYPAIYMYELSLLPQEICTRKPPTKVQPLSKDNITYDKLDWVTVYNKNFGGRGHHIIDWIAVFFILIFGVISVGVAYTKEVITIGRFGSLHLIAFLLLGNIIGLSLIIIGWLRWKNREVKWPIPKNLTANSKKGCQSE